MYKFTHLEKIIGGFVVLAILVLIVAIIFIAKGQKLIVKKVYYYTQFNSAENLSVGMPVKFKGLKIGAVTEIKLTPSDKFLVKFYVLKEYANKVKKDSVVAISSALFIGEKSLTITPGTKKSEIAKEEDYLFSTDTELGRKMFKAQIGKEPTPSTEEILNNVRLLTAQLSDPNGSLMRTLQNAKLLTRNITETYSKNKDSFEKIIKNLEFTTKNLRDVVRKLKENPILNLGAKLKKSSPKRKKKR